MSADTLIQTAEREWALTGHWTVHRLGPLAGELAQRPCAAGEVVLDGTALQAIDSAGALLLQHWLGGNGARPRLRGWAPRFERLMTLAQARDAAAALPEPPRPSRLERAGLWGLRGLEQAQGLLAFIGELALAVARLARRPGRIRGRAVLHNLQVSGFEALPIVGLTAFLLGVVVAYQGADQLRHYGANIFVVELVGYSMLREFAPLISAIIIAGRSGSAYAAQIGTMLVTEEVDAMRTLGIDPLELLVLPKVAALAIALPLLTVFADVTGIFGGMLMARAQLDVGFPEFIDRLGRELQGSSFLIGVGKAWVFALVIAVIGCFQGFRTVGSADSVGRQTTLAVVQAIFLVIVADALFSIAFSILDL